MVPFPKNLNSLPKDAIRNFLNSFDTVLVDCDGVLWLENELIEGSQHVINKFVEHKKNLFYVTNNSSKIREDFVEKFHRLGFSATEETLDIPNWVFGISDPNGEPVKPDLQENVITTAYLVADYLKSINFNKTVYVMGSEGIIKELSRVGIQHTGFGPDVLTTTLEELIQKKINLNPNVGAVLQGFDENFSYPKILKATTYLRDPNVLFLATCPDETFPYSRELILPSTGSLLKCVEAATGRKAFVLGKPNDYMREAIGRKQKLDPKRTLMIGDRLNTDILFGNRCGFQTLLVLSGVSSLSDVEKCVSSKDPNDAQVVPKYYIKKLGDLLEYM